MEKKNTELVRKFARYNGRRYTASGATEREAMMNLAEKLAAAKRGEEATGGKMSVNAWFKQWIELYKKPKGMTEKSLKMYTEKYNNYIGPRIGNMRIEDVRDVHLQSILNDQAGKSASHVKKLCMVLKQMFRRARQSRIIAYDPAELLELPNITEGKRRSITEEERKAILSVAKYHPAGLLVLTLLYTGMRPGETAALTWANVDFENNEIHVHVARESGSKRIKAPKTGAGVRDIPIHSALLPRLLEARKKPLEPVFPNEAGKHMDDSTLYRRWKSFLRELDIFSGAEVYRNKIIKHAIAQDLTPYCLRHTFCTDLQKAGVPLNVAKELMGHSDISVTANIYTHKDSGTLHKNMALLDGTGTQSDTQKRGDRSVSIAAE